MTNSVIKQGLKSVLIIHDYNNYLLTNKKVNHEYSRIKFRLNDRVDE